MLCAFGLEVFSVITLLVWNHNTIYQGGWQDLATGLADMVILGGALLYSFLWTVTALIKLVMYKRTAEPIAGTTTRYGYEIALHCVAMIALSIVVSRL